LDVWGRGAAPNTVTKYNALVKCVEQMA